MLASNCTCLDLLRIDVYAALNHSKKLLVRVMCMVVVAVELVHVLLREVYLLGQEGIQAV